MFPYPCLSASRNTVGEDGGILRGHPDELYLDPAMKGVTHYTSVDLINALMF